MFFMIPAYCEIALTLAWNQRQRAKYSKTTVVSK